ncbi:MAG: NAD(P)/FAD-dependent oxidoreductase [Verrucomicrobia bacterium]|nr:NAD(P)/FAD-dependent oxidoreductase [Verrucomicrobiota bacterium]
MSESYDALIIGGGPAGATSAALLANAGWSVALLEKARFPRQKVCGEFVSSTNERLFRQLGIADSFRELAGPAIRRVGLFARDTIVTADVPTRGRRHDCLGRALGRDRFDAVLLERARSAGATVLQPWSAVALHSDVGGFACQAVCQDQRRTQTLRARIVIAAHGSWEQGRLPTQSTNWRLRDTDLLGFKARFRNSGLPPDLMPLLAFPGGYGGLVHSDSGRISLSCCVRRDQLAQLRPAARGASAGQCLLEHIQQSCLGAREALAGATQDGLWLSVGPIQPGIRFRNSRGVFLVGNAAGEAHPVIAEGISMALQSAGLLCERLIAQRAEVLSGKAVERVGSDYAAAWRRSFARRIRTAAVIAHWAMTPAAVICLLPWLRLIPGVLPMGVTLSGKTEESREFADAAPAG